MNSPEDTGSRTPRDAEAFERWRARNYDAPDEDERPTRRRGLRWDGCRCHSASEEPCDWCSRPGDEGDDRE